MVRVVGLISFRDRVGEISKLIKFPYSGNPVAIVYGPKGCGKSELSRPSSTGLVGLTIGVLAWRFSS
jgi:ABC-type iron transport system FetAB ATPase subunit